ncbi:hypothetical protein BDY17DRAFT_45435 [Neohortaea acidophila]|uniref:F-box domain-containing protein n=1 Tax=Neohortaea acidophila TaxID=245834 RepID=A0A6A6PID8_9PEZI|nr:uncharacterized protein BDY17DRAFT_45435 [Neohortaea acidophila]KAF2479772.1 hypothetical protein BDY17DRAFT_45435 [Neohortaea acidophila]
MSPHLPNELWILVFSHCSPKDLWLSLRPINTQLRTCTEEYYARHYLPLTQLTLPITLPTYDMRNPIRGKAVFHPGLLGNSEESGRALYDLVGTDPSHYREHFLGRWKGMGEGEGRWLRETVVWEMGIAEGGVREVRLRRPRVEGIGVQGDLEVARVSFEWRGTVSSFFR